MEKVTISINHNAMQELKTIKDEMTELNNKMRNFTAKFIDCNDFLEFVANDKPVSGN